MSARSVEELTTIARDAVRELAGSEDPAAFPALLGLSEEVGIGLGLAARTLAQAASWSDVATYAGTTKQAAWSRWRK